MATYENLCIYILWFGIPTYTSLFCQQTTKDSLQQSAMYPDLDFNAKNELREARISR